jgi:RNA polymerase sigma-70 factor (ECF subfamily)
MNENILIEGLKKKDKQIQAKLFKRWYRYLYTVAFRIVKNKMDAEDVLQESFVRIFDKIDYFTPGKSFRAWMCKIVYNRAISHYQSNKKHNKCEMIEGFEPMKKIAPNFIDSYLAKDTYRKALRELHLKSPNQYMYARLYFEEDMSREEIAKDIAVPLGTVKSQVSRAASSLRTYITKFDKINVFNK